MSSASDLMQLALNLRAVARDDGSIDAAQVRLIGLDDIRIAAGEKWPRLRERVCEGSLQILSRFVTSQDIIVPAGDGFLVILAEGAPGANQARCQAMREALVSFYLGDEALKTLRADVTARSLSAEGFADLIASNLGGDAGIAARDSLLRGDITEARVFSMRERRVVARWFCPVRAEVSGRRLAYDRDFILDGAHHGHEFLDLDLAILDYAQRRDAEQEDDSRVGIGFTVHASTLQTRRRREIYYGALARAPMAFRARAIITIAEVERGAPLMSLCEWCCTLRTIFPKVCLDLHYSDHAIASIGATGAWAAGFHLPIYSGAQKGARASRTLEQIRYWAKALHGQGMRLCVNGLREPGFVEEARAAGADIATSDALWPFSEKDERAALLVAMPGPATA